MIKARLLLAARDLELELTLPAGATTVIMGPNGAGKSTVAGLLSGLLRPDPGSQITVDGTEITQLPPYRRRIGLVAQQPRLFPHRTVLDNVAYAPLAAGIRKPAARRLAEELLTQFGVADLAARPADQISGGQAQRVALARALAAQPRLLLLDEPFAGLDVDVAAGVRTALSRQLAGLSCLLISHDPTDALLLADRLVIIESGRISQSGSPAQVLQHPTSSFVARLGQLNLLTGTGTAHGRLATELGQVSGQGQVADGMPGVAVFAPTAVAVYSQPPDSSLRNLFECAVAGLTPTGTGVSLTTAQGLRAQLTAEAVAALELGPGNRVWLGVKAQQVRLSAAPPSRTDRQP